MGVFNVFKFINGTAYVYDSTLFAFFSIIILSEMFVSLLFVPFVTILNLNFAFSYTLLSGKKSTSFIGAMVPGAILDSAHHHILHNAVAEGVKRYTYSMTFEILYYIL